MTSKFKAPLAAAMILAVSLLAACSSAPPQIAPPPPAPPPAPAAVLGPRLIEQASAYRLYMDRVMAVTPAAFTDADSVAKALQVGEAYEPTQLLRGAIAYGAVAALQDPAFVAGVRKYAGNADQRREVAYSIMKDPAYAVGLEGSASAAGLVIQALGGEGQKLYDAGKTVKQSAYDIQKQPWSKADVPNRDQRLSQAKMLSSTPLVGDLAVSARLTRASSGAESLGLPPAASVAPPYSPVVIRSLAVAALAVLGEAGDANIDTVMAVMAEPNVGFCLSLAKLNLYQCLAVSKPHYEDVFCLGQHAMMDTGRCLIKASGLPEPFEAKFVPVADDKHGYNAPKKPAKKPVKKKR